MNPCPCWNEGKSFSKFRAVWHAFDKSLKYSGPAWQHCVQDRAEANTAGEGNGDESSPACAGARLFPFMLQQRCPDLFSYTASNFRVQRSKAGTARVVCWQELGIANRCCLVYQVLLLYHNLPASASFVLLSSDSLCGALDIAEHLAH